MQLWQAYSNNLLRSQLFFNYFVDNVDKHIFGFKNDGYEKQLSPLITQSMQIYDYINSDNRYKNKIPNTLNLW